MLEVPVANGCHFYSENDQYVGLENCSSVGNSVTNVSRFSILIQKV